MSIAALGVACAQSLAAAHAPRRISLAPRIVAPRAPHAHGLHRHAADSDRDGLPNRVEVKRTRTNPHRADTDGDGLKDGVEVRRTRTNPRRADTDGDGLSDWTEVRRTRTNPRRADSDGDGFSDGEESIAGSDPWDPASVPVLPLAVPSGLAAPPPPGPPPAPEPGTPGGGSPPPGEETGEEPPPPPPPYPSGCPAEATSASTAAQVRSAVQGNHDVCVVEDVGDVNLRSLGDRAGVVISTDGGSMGFLDLYDTTNLTIRSARFRSAELWYANGTLIEGCRIGGTEAHRTTDTLLNILASPDVTVRGNELAWTDSSDTENVAGYGIRSPGITNANNDRLRIEGNYIHHIGADGIQGLGESENVVIDRNRFDYIGKTPETSEHSDVMQIYGSGPDNRITNNSISHEGYYTQGQISGSSGTLYVHNGETDALLIENNLFRDTQGTILFGVSPPSEQSMANLTFRHNTVLNVGQAYGGGWTGLQWGIVSGSNNRFERNIAQSDDGGISFPYGGSASAATFAENLWRTGDVLSFDAEGNCTSAACNPGAGTIGYRKPSGVSW